MLSLIAPPVGLVDGDELWYPSKCKFCICFEDGDLIDVTGTFAEITLQLPSQPSNGQTFTFNGRLFTYKTVVSADWDILIGAVTNDTLLNTAAALLTLPDVNRADYYVLPFAGFIIVTAIKVGDDWTLSFTAGTSPLVLITNVAGVNPSLVSADYRANFEILVRNTATDYDWVSIKGFTVVPKITADPIDATWTAELCSPIDTFLLSQITRTRPDLAVTVGMVFYYDWLIDFRIRYASYQNLIESPWAESGTYYATDAICPDYLDYEEYSHKKSKDYILYMLTKRDGLRYCEGTIPFFYAAVDELLEYTLEVTWYVGGLPVSNGDILTTTRSGIVCIAPSVYYPSGYTGEVQINLFNEKAIDYETINFTLGGSCCGNTFYFINRFGKYEILQTLSDAETGLEVEVSEYTTCDSCESSEETIEYSTRFTQRYKAYSNRLDLDSDEDMNYVRDFFTSTEVLLLNEFGELERVIVEKGSIALRENAGQRKVRFAIDYRRQSKTGN